MDKNGISPLIATVLIIGFTVALAAVVMTWGGTFIRETTESTETSTSQAIKCATELNFKIINVSCSADAGSLDRVIIDNSGSVDIQSLMFRIHFEDGSVTKDSTTGVAGVPAYEVLPFTLTDITATTEKVEAIATIAGVGGGEDYTCVEAVQKFLIDCNG